jgi:hypothetical protein
MCRFGLAHKHATVPHSHIRIDLALSGREVLEHVRLRCDNRAQRGYSMTDSSGPLAWEIVVAALIVLGYIFLPASESHRHINPIACTVVIVIWILSFILKKPDR